MRSNAAHRGSPLIAHIVFRFDYGGLENGVVNVINGLPDAAFKHVVIALSEATEFTGRLKGGVVVETIGKKAGKDPGAYLRLYKLLRRLKPDIVHSRNLGTLECAFVAFLAGVPVRIHGEHGWDIFDPDGTKRKYRYMRRLMAPFIKRFVTVSQDLERWLIDVVRIPGDKVKHICNGVDSDKFQPAKASEKSPLPPGFAGQDDIVVGTVTRFSAIKDPLNLVRAYIDLRQKEPALSNCTRLVMAGDGELREQAEELLDSAGLREVCWLPGSRDDIPELLKAMDIFVLGSFREGISNTVLEAMASGLPIIATGTGGNLELVADRVNGCLIAPGDGRALTAAILEYLHEPKRRIDHGKASRLRVESLFSLDRMIENYRLLYESELGIQRI